MRMRLLCLLAAALALPTALPARGEGPLKVTSALVCDWEDEECTSAEQSFDEKVKALRFVTVVEGATGEAWVEHVWKREGREVFRLRLNVRPHRSRTASKKTVAGFPGAWTAVVVDPVGRELAKVSFRVEGSEPAP